MAGETEGNDDIRSLLSAAIDKSEQPETPAPVEAAPEAPAAPVEEPAATAEPAAEDAPEASAESQDAATRDDKGRFAKGKEKAPTKPTTPKPTEAAPVGAATPPRPGPTVKPPQSWTPAAREKWAALPPEVQKEVTRREREASTALQESAEDRKFAATMRVKLSPFDPMIRAIGVEAPAIVEDLLRTAYNLRTAPPQHKAAIVASIIQGQGVDPALVGQFLQGQPPQPSQQPAPVDPNAIAAQVEERIRKQMEERQAQEKQQRHEAEVEAFAADPSHEFFDDLREVMGDLISARAARGLNMSLQEAYDAACKLDPEISQVLQQRAAAQQANATMASTQRARDAASSVRSQPMGAPVAAPPEPEDLKGQLEAAWIAHAGR